MTKFATRMMMTAAAATMAFAPIAAQAGTRASDSGAVYSVSAPGVGREDDGEKLAGISIILVLFTITASLAGIGFATGVIGNNNDNGQSPGR